MLLLLFLVYLKVSTKAFEIMHCIDVDGTSYLFADL